ncbi:hypothetical protein K3495_g10912 [Podosphaera aphanis]|nr:hypothetical protein K3495_g10912 [Podosphaera aphanis]
MNLAAPTRNTLTPSKLCLMDTLKPDSIFPSDDDHMLQRWSSIIGIITAICGNILISIALNIQRLAHIKIHKVQEENSTSRISAMSSDELRDYKGIGNDCTSRKLFQKTRFSQSLDQSDSPETSYLKSPYWWAGIALMTIGEAGNFLAYGFAPASIVSPLGVVALISNCVIAPILLKENFRSRDFWGVVVAVAGAVTVVLSAKQEEQKLGPQEIWAAITTIEFEIYMVTTISLIGTLMWASSKYGRKTIFIDLGLVGLFGGYTALSTKGIASLLSFTFWRTLTTPITYGLALVMTGTAVMQVRYVNKALQRFDSTQVIPVQFVTFTLSVIIGSGILYRDFEKATLDSGSKFFGGCLLTFMGVWLITSRRPSHDESHSNNEDIHNQALQQRNYSSHIDQEIVGESIDSHVRDIGNDGVENFFNTKEAPPQRFTGSSSRPRTAHMYSDGSSQPTSRSLNEETPLLRNTGKNPEHLLQTRHIEIDSSSLSPNIQTNHILLGEPLIPFTLPRSFSQEDSNLQKPVTYLGLKSGKSNSLARLSVSKMIPGPLISPLSGGLSGVVVDSLRRGANSSLGRKKHSKIHRFLRKSQSGFFGFPRQENTEDELVLTPTKENEDTSHRFSLSLEGGDRLFRQRTPSVNTALESLLLETGHTRDIEANREAGPSRL